MTPFHIKLPSERGEQLKTLARSRGLAVTDLIGEWINGEIAAGNLADVLPGFDVTAARGKIVLTLDDLALQPMTIASAAAAAEAIERMLVKRGAYLDLDVPELLKIERVGTGISISAKRDGQEVRKVVAPSVARDLARLLRKASQA